MPSYRSLLVLALAASTVAPVLAAEAAIQPLKKNEGRALSHLELVERDKQPLEVPAPSRRPERLPERVPLLEPAPESEGVKLSGKMKALIGAGLVVTIAADWAILAHFRNTSTNSNQSDSTPPDSAPPSLSAETYGNTTTGSTQQISTNNGTNSRREEHPRGRHSPVDIPSELYPESESRIDAAADGNVTYAGI